MLRFLVRVASLALVVAAVAGCLYRADPPEGSLRCDEHQRCPGGYLCNAIRQGAVVTLVCCRTVGCPGVAASSTSAVTVVGPTGDGGTGQR